VKLTDKDNTIELADSESSFFQSIEGKKTAQSIMKKFTNSKNENKCGNFA